MMFLVSKTEEMIHFDDRFYSNTVGEANVQPVCRAWCKSSILLRVVGGPSRLQVIIQFAPFRLFGVVMVVLLNGGGGLSMGGFLSYF